MALFNDIRGLFSRRKQVTVLDISDTQASGLQDAASDGNASGNGSSLMVSSTSALRSRGKPDPQQSYEQVMGLVHKLSEHVDRQTERTEQLLSLLEKLPEGLASLPESNRQHAKLLDLLTQHLGRAELREEAINAALSRLHESTGHQADVLGLLQQQLDANHQSSRSVFDALNDVKPAVNDLAASGKRSSDLLADIASSSEHREQRLASTIKSTHVWMIAALALCGIASLAAVAVSVFALLARR